MSTIEKIKRRLQKYPHAMYEEAEDSITILPANENGFAVGFAVEGERYCVSAQHWHEECETEDEALAWFAWLLSDSGRLKVDARGRFEYRWVVEIVRDNEWVEANITGLFFFPFWMKKRTVYFQNELIKNEDPIGFWQRD